jgi:hypothetical protein
VTLGETQQLLWRLITAPEGVAAALAADADRGGSIAAQLARTVRSDRLEAAQRLDIYANMYFFRILDVLKEEFPATAALLGEVGFHNLVTDYLLRHPPAHFSIREAGRQLPELLAGHAATALHPCAADLAAYERALRDAFDAADAPPLTASALAAVPQSDWASLRFALHPSVRVIASDWPVDVVRAAVDQGESPADPEAIPTRVCVWRHEFAVLHRALSSGELAGLSAIARGASFEDVCSVIGEPYAADAAAREVAVALARWLADGWLVEPSTTQW